MTGSDGTTSGCRGSIRARFAAPSFGLMSDNFAPRRTDVPPAKFRKADDWFAPDPAFSTSQYAMTSGVGARTPRLLSESDRSFISLSVGALPKVFIFCFFRWSLWGFYLFIGRYAMESHKFLAEFAHSDLVLDAELMVGMFPTL